MDAEQKKGMSTGGWWFALIPVGLALTIFGQWIGRYCFPEDWVTGLMISSSLVGGLVLSTIFFVILRKSSYTVIENELSKNSQNKKLSLFMIFNSLLFVFLFGSILVGSVENIILNMSILVSSDRSIQLKVPVFNVDRAPIGGSCHGTKYTFHNTPVNNDSEICDTQLPMAFLKNGDVLLIREKSGFVGVHFLSAQYAYSS